MIVCPICKAENESSAKECILCGVELKENEPPTPTLEDENNGGPDLPQTVSEKNAVPSLKTQAPTGERYNIRKAFSGVQTPIPKPPENLDKNAVTPGSTLPPEFSIRALSTEESEFKDLSYQNKLESEPEIPPPGTLCLVVYHKRKPVLYFPIIYEEILIGRMDPSSNSYPDLDLTPFDPELAISRKHCYILREGDNYYIYPISNSGTQVEQELVDIGTKKKLKEGDVIILSGRVALRFYRIPPAPK